MQTNAVRMSVRVIAGAILVSGVTASFLLSCQAGAARPSAQRLDNGRRIYVASCAMCHGDQGNGDGPLASELVKEAGTPPAKINDPARLAALGRAGVKQIIVEGGGHRSRSNLMPAWGDKLSVQNADDVTDFVMSLPGLNPAIPAATLDKYMQAPPGSPVEGQRLFAYYCAGCHGLAGKGDGVYAQTLRARDKIWPRNLTQTSYLANKTDQELFVTVSLGGGHVGKSTMMPAWSVSLTPEQIKHLVSYIRAISKTKSKP
jgi:mono/diheme cytochrome c family protein